MAAKKLMTVLVCGGRDYADSDRLYRVLDFNRAKIGLIVHGAATGADELANQWALQRTVPCLRVPALWKVHGRKAGYLRNEQMLRMGKPDLVVAFPGGPGTAMMIELAKKKGVRVIEIDRPSPISELPLEDMPDTATLQALALHDGAPT